MKDERLELLSDKVRRGIPIGFIEALEVIEYQESIKKEKVSWRQKIKKKHQKFKREKMKRLEKQSNKIMAPYLENVSLAQQREKIKEELEEMINASRYAKRRDVFIARFLPKCMFMPFYKKRIKDTKDSEVADYLIACFSYKYIARDMAPEFSKNADEMISNAKKLLGDYLNLRVHVILKIRYNKHRGDIKIRRKK